MIALERRSREIGVDVFVKDCASTSGVAIAITGYRRTDPIVDVAIGA